MGISTVTAARILGGQKLGKPGEEHILNFEQFEDVALSKVIICIEKIIANYIFKLANKTQFCFIDDETVTYKFRGL
jgi:hypothetical protein